MTEAIDGVLTLVFWGLMLFTLWIVHQNRAMMKHLLWLRSGDRVAQERTLRFLSQILSGSNRLENNMGVVKDILTGVQGNIEEYVRETDERVAELLKRDTLDADDKATLEALRARAQELANVVPNAVTIPLPDPQNTVDLNPTANDVLDPSEVTTTEGSTES